MDLSIFEKMLISNTESLDNMNQSIKSEVSYDVVGLLRAHDFSKLEEILPQLTKKDVNSNAVMTALVENFNTDIAELLCEKGLDPLHLIDAGSVLITAPCSKFWDWFLTSSLVSEEAHESVFEGAFELVCSSVGANDPRRTSSAHFALMLHKHNPKLCTIVLRSFNLERLVINKHQKNINQIQWDMLNACIDNSLCEDIQFEIDPYGLSDFEQLVGFCKHVSSLNNLYNKQFDEAKKMHAWKMKALHSPTGELKDCNLIQSSSSDKRSKILKTLKECQDRRFEGWGVSELEMVVLGDRDASNGQVSEKNKVREKMNHSGGYQNFLHMLLDRMGSNCVKALRESEDVEQQVVKTLDLIDCHTFVELSKPTGLAVFLKKFPKVLEWSDTAGNNFGHYIALNMDLTPSSLKLLLQNPLLRRSNPAGVSPRDILQSRTWDEKILADFDQWVSQYDKKVLIQSIKQLPNAGEKLRARKKAPSRKM